MFNRLSTLFRQREIMTIAETGNGEEMHVSVEEPSVTITQYSDADSDVIGIEEGQLLRNQRTKYRLRSWRL